ncbi:MAG TPA: RHS repeat-associated core domain-containing protein, partial [Nitrospiria bacterium]|nr:RHS repeat-associated core domain-containing protein [Nitrospiria bacterium]
NGNLTNDGSNIYTWDARDRLASMAGASFEYDAVGRRITKTISGVPTSYLYDGQNPVQELSGTTPTANLITGLGMDEFLTRTDSAGTQSFFTDGLGSTLALTDTSGTVQTEYTYEPFGKTTATGTTSSNSFQFTGRENDGTGLYYYRARYYNPNLHRFLSEDPLLGGFISSPNGPMELMVPRLIKRPEMLHPYAYVGDNPIDRIDPTGLLMVATHSSGNFAPGFGRQDQECSWPAGKFNRNPCTKQCCVTHDHCYELHQCNFSSWITNATTYLMGPFGPCTICNSNVFACLIHNVGKGDCKSCKGN